MEQKLRAAVEQWQAILGKQVAQARQIDQKLLAGVVLGGLQAVASPRGMEGLQVPIGRWFVAA